MNIPLDRLYQYIENIAKDVYGDCVLIYRFWPHGSKNINDLGPEEPVDWQQYVLSPIVWAHDQEPLNYEFYKTHLRDDNIPWKNLLKSLDLLDKPKNLNYLQNVFEKNILLHSEKRSTDLEKYKNDHELIPVYYWSHAIIAKDWYRYAEYEQFEKSSQKTFLIYNRAWSGTREYRLRFADLLLRLGLENDCKMSINPIEPELEIHYELHKFINPIWRPTQVLEDHFPRSTAKSYYSADFDTDDYNSTDIEVVLETLFDDKRLHLTEKSLRPIACGQPFILAGTYGSLEYLRSYGFKTFGHIWDERYDECEDPEERLGRIVDLMKQITNWLPHQRENKMAQAQIIAEYNRQHFFSKEFINCIVSELKNNLNSAFVEIKQSNNYVNWLDRWDNFLSYPEIIEFLESNQNLRLPTKKKVDVVIQLVRQNLNNKS